MFRIFCVFVTSSGGGRNVKWCKCKKDLLKHRGRCKCRLLIKEKKTNRINKDHKRSETRARESRHEAHTTDFRQQQKSLVTKLRKLRTSKRDTN